MTGLAALGLLACIGCGGRTVTLGTVTSAGGSGGSSGTGGASATGGAGGSAGAPVVKANKLDLLFMIDNSPSMTDKQTRLAETMPQLLSRLITPDCVDAAGNVVGQTDASGRCAFGQPEFRPLRDIHVGIVSSSLGDRGAGVCTPVDAPPADDMGELVATPGLRSPTPVSYDNSGFLAWDPSGTANRPPGENNLKNLLGQFTQMVQATGQAGCGFPSQLESWYRFLIDPDPPKHLDVTGSGGSRQTVKVGAPDQTVLAERAAFLRPNSLVAIVMLTDHDDCSMLDHGQAFLVGSAGHPLPRATSACNTNPNSKCCFSCGQIGTTPSGCPLAKQDSNCRKGPYTDYDNKDNLNLRCFDQKRRFGISFLFPTQRYVNALTQTEICPNHDDLSCGRGDTPVLNPLFNTQVGGTVVPRSPSLVFLTGIVGVPWQDIATRVSLQPGSIALRYLTAKRLAQPISNPKGSVPPNATYWDLILGNPEASPPAAPLDPFMHESIAPRSGANPITGDAIEPPTSTTWNAINGHEDDVTDGSQLQYACIFRLPVSRDCSYPGYNRECDCNAASGVQDNPLCQRGAGQPYDTTQYFTKGYPGLRELEVLKGLGSQAVVGSICPKNLCNNPGDPSCANLDYNYNPAVQGLIEAIKSHLE